MMKTDPDLADRDFFTQLRNQVEKQIAEYVYVVPSGAVGTPLSAKKIEADLQLMRVCLVEPRWEEVEIRDTFDQVKTNVGPRRKCVTIAEDTEGYVLMFDPVESSFVLAFRQSEGLGTFGIRGDAVGCFLAR
jgi:hypothetical protein